MGERGIRLQQRLQPRIGSMGWQRRAIFLVVVSESGKLKGSECRVGQQPRQFVKIPIPNHGTDIEGGECVIGCHIFGHAVTGNAASRQSQLGELWQSDQCLFEESWPIRSGPIHEC